MKCLLALYFIEIVFFQGVRISTERDVMSVNLQIHVSVLLMTQGIVFFLLFGGYFVIQLVSFKDGFGSRCVVNWQLSKMNTVVEIRVSPYLSELA